MLKVDFLCVNILLKTELKILHKNIIYSWMSLHFDINMSLTM